jgi:hypothetical protein
MVYVKFKSFSFWNTNLCDRIMAYIFVKLFKELIYFAYSINIEFCLANFGRTLQCGDHIFIVVY